MDTKLTGLINEGDTGELRRWIEKFTGASASHDAEMAELRLELGGIRQSLEAIQKKVDTIERLLMAVAE